MKLSLLWWTTAAFQIHQSYAQFFQSNSFFFPAGFSSDLLVEAGEWREANDTNPDTARVGVLGLRSTSKGQILFSFKGSQFSLRISRPQGSSIQVWIDGKRSPFPFIPESECVIPYPANTTGLTTWIKEMSAMEGNIGGGNHQLLVNITASKDAPVIFDRIEAVVDSPPAIPDDYTPSAGSVPAGSTEDDMSPLLAYSDFGWEHHENPVFWKNTSSITSTPGAWVQVTFVGTGLWLYGAIPLEGSVFRVEATKRYGQEVTSTVTTHNVTRPDLEVPIYQAPLFKQPTLPYTNAYVYNFTLISGQLQLDFIRVVGSVVSPDFEDMGTSQPPATLPSRDPKVIVIPVVVAVTLVLCAGALAFFIRRRYIRRRGRERATNGDSNQSGKESDVHPFHVDSIAPSPMTTHSQSRLTKSGHQPSIAGSFPSARPPPSTSYWHVGSPTGSSFSVSNPIAMTVDVPGGGGQEEGENGGALSLTHSELARVFRRAEELRSRDGDVNREGGADTVTATDTEMSGELEPPLEALARQLANRDSALASSR